MIGGRVLIHDGSFPGYICALCVALNERRDPRIGVLPELRGPAEGAGLFEESETVSRDDDRAARFLERLADRLGGSFPTNIPEAFCSDIPGIGTALAHAIERLWVVGEAAVDDLGDADMLLVERAANRTRREAHRFLGLVRFRELEDTSLYSAIEPDCDILGFIAPHFAARFPALRWAIKDEGRGKAVLHEADSAWTIVEHLEVETKGGRLPLSEGEGEIEGYWRSYFETVAIRERENSRLQASFMPKKHWKHLPEVSPSQDRARGLGAPEAGASGGGRAGWVPRDSGPAASGLRWPSQ